MPGISTPWPGAVASPMSPAQVTLHLDRTQASLTRTLENAIPRTVRLAKTLTDEQVARFMADRVTRQQERQHDFATQSKAEMIKGAFGEKMNERLVFWIGKVKPAQEPLITQWAEWQYEMMAPGSTFRRPGPRSWIG